MTTNEKGGIEFNVFQPLQNKNSSKSLKNKKFGYFLK